MHHDAVQGNQPSVRLFRIGSTARSARAATVSVGFAVPLVTMGLVPTTKQLRVPCTRRFLSVSYTHLTLPTIYSV